MATKKKFKRRLVDIEENDKKYWKSKTKCKKHEWKYAELLQREYFGICRRELIFYCKHCTKIKKVDL